MRVITSPQKRPDAGYNPAPSQVGTPAGSRGGAGRIAGGTQHNAAPLARIGRGVSPRAVNECPERKDALSASAGRAFGNWCTCMSPRHIAPSIAAGFRSRAVAKPERYVEGVGIIGARALTEDCLQSTRVPALRGGHENSRFSCAHRIFDWQLRTGISWFALAPIPPNIRQWP